MTEARVNFKRRIATPSSTQAAGDGGLTG